MGNYATTEANRLGRLRRRALDNARRAIDEMRTHAETIAADAELRASDDYKRAPGPTRHYIDGMLRAAYELRWREVQFAYVTPRGIVTTHDKGPAGVLCRLTDSEHAELAKRDDYPRGFIWSRLDSRGAVRWYCGPDRSTTPNTGAPSAQEAQP